MLKFVVGLYRRPDLSPQQFHAILRGEHAELAERLPGLLRYVQNHVVPDPSRAHPGWDGGRATSHLSEFVDLSRSTWSVVGEEVRR